MCSQLILSSLSLRSEMEPTQAPTTTDNDHLDYHTMTAQEFDQLGLLPLPSPPDTSNISYGPIYGSGTAEKVKDQRWDPYPRTPQDDGDKPQQTLANKVATIDTIFGEVLKYLRIREIIPAILLLSKWHHKLVLKGQYSGQIIMDVATDDWGIFAQKRFSEVLASARNLPNKEWPDNDPPQWTGYHILRELYVTLDWRNKTWEDLTDIIALNGDEKAAGGLAYEGFANLGVACNETSALTTKYSTYIECTRQAFPFAKPSYWARKLLGKSNKGGPPSKDKVWEYEWGIAKRLFKVALVEGRTDDLGKLAFAYIGEIDYATREDGDSLGDLFIIIDSLNYSRDIKNILRMWRILNSRSVFSSLSTDEEWMDISKFKPLAAFHIFYMAIKRREVMEKIQRNGTWNSFGRMFQQTIWAITKSTMQRIGKKFVPENEKTELLASIARGWGTHPDVLTKARVLATFLWYDGSEAWERDKASLGLRLLAGRFQLNQSYTEDEQVEVMRAIARLFITDFTIPSIRWRRGN